MRVVEEGSGGSGPFVNPGPELAGDGRRRIPEKSASSSAKKGIKRNACLECRRDESDVACVCARASMRRQTREISPSPPRHPPLVILSSSRRCTRWRTCLSIYRDFRRAPSVTRQPRNRRLTFHASDPPASKRDWDTSRGPEGARRRAVFLVAIATELTVGVGGELPAARAAAVRTRVERVICVREAREIRLCRAGPESLGSVYLPLK